jgi:hypothetical protein
VHDEPDSALDVMHLGRGRIHFCVRLAFRASNAPSTTGRFGHVMPMDAVQAPASRGISM